MTTCQMVLFFYNVKGESTVQFLTNWICLTLDAAEPAAHPSTPPSQTRPTIVQLDTTTERTLPMTTATTAPPPIRSASVDSWQSEVVFKGYVYNFKRVCIHRNRVMFLRGEFPRPQVPQQIPSKHVSSNWSLNAVGQNCRIHKR